jgi:tetrahydromethanopterin S-methyltransferase subunit A
MGTMENFGFFLSRTFATTKAKKRIWPFVPGSYYVLDPAAPVAVTTLGSVALAKEVADAKPTGLCIVGKVETENIGIEKIIRNVISNPAIRYFVCAGAEPPKHLTGATFLALFKNGIDAARRIPGSPGMRPVLPNLDRAEVDAFRRQVEPINLIGCTDPALIAVKVAELAARAPKPPLPPLDLPVPPAEAVVPHVVATAPPPDRIKLDKGGYFVIDPRAEGLFVEHYDYRDRLLRTIEGPDARTVYWSLILNGWVTKLDHAAYLGKELARADLCRKLGQPFVQDAA